jgi:hypothetical protein
LGRKGIEIHCAACLGYGPVVVVMTSPVAEPELTRERQPSLWPQLLHIVITRIRHHQPTRNRVVRCLAEGTKISEIARTLKRYAARGVKPFPPQAALYVLICSRRYGRRVVRSRRPDLMWRGTHEEQRH